MFPRGTTQSPDAKLVRMASVDLSKAITDDFSALRFIFESIDAARQILQLCTERVRPSTSSGETKLTSKLTFG